MKTVEQLVEKLKSYGCIDLKISLNSDFGWVYGETKQGSSFEIMIFYDPTVKNDLTIEYIETTYIQDGNIHKNLQKSKLYKQEGLAFLTDY